MLLGIFLHPYLDCKKNFFLVLELKLDMRRRRKRMDAINFLNYVEKNTHIQMKVVTFYGLIEKKMILKPIESIVL